MSSYMEPSEQVFDSILQGKKHLDGKNFAGKFYMFTEFAREFGPFIFVFALVFLQ